jgi:hypothetical protein
MPSIFLNNWDKQTKNQGKPEIFTQVQYYYLNNYFVTMVTLNLLRKL